ncbi:MAG: hypothetical protein DRJ42_02185 [Deltaproteobacteria bacterium]|nr:MAG: hypothetical protein DRJ42_02185 [Deltaproteobacteria bacterium]
MSLSDQLRALLRRISRADGPEPPRKPGPTPKTGEARSRQTDTAPGPRDAAILAASARCTACGLCDVAFDAYELTERPTFRGPSELALSYARRPTEHSAAKRYIASLRRGDLTALARICPVGVPFPELADAIDRLADASALEAPPRETERARHDPG